MVTVPVTFNTIIQLNDTPCNAYPTFEDHGIYTLCPLVVLGDGRIVLGSDWLRYAL